jgi:hypothetical protein
LAGSRFRADGGYRGPRFQAALNPELRQAQTGIVNRFNAANGFGLPPRQQVIGRGIA